VNGIRRVGIEDVSAELKRRASNIPLGRYGDPQEIAATVAFLASDGAAYITAQSITVDGGSVPVG